MSDAICADWKTSHAPPLAHAVANLTANTMSTVMEIIGLSPWASTASAMRPEERSGLFPTDCRKLVLNLLRKGIAAEEILTRPAFDNAIAAVATTSGCPPMRFCVFLAIAREAGVPLPHTTISRKSASASLTGRFEAFRPFRGHGYASRRRVSTPFEPAVAGGPHSRNALTVSGLTLGAGRQERRRTPGQEVIAPLDQPLKKTGELVILHGNLAPEGVVAKISGHDV